VSEYCLVFRTWTEMAIWRLILVLGMLSHNTVGAAETSNPIDEAKCFVGTPSIFGTNYQEKNESTFTSLVCERVGVDGKSLTEVIRTIYRRYDNKTFTIEELGPRITVLSVSTSKNATFPQDGFSKFTALENLTIADSMAARKSTVEIAPNALTSLKNIRKLDLNQVRINPASVATLAEIADKVSYLTILESIPSVEILTEIGKFTNLSKLDLYGMCKDGPVPESTFKNSAAKLEKLKIVSCESPTALTVNMFRGMSNLIELWWTNSNVTEIESGAFDDLSNVSGILLGHDHLKSLPDGVFSKNTNLKFVSLCDNSIRNIWLSNFTQSKEFKALKFDCRRAMRL